MIEIKSKSAGGELTSIVVNNIEYLHDGITVWNRHSPILFPIVGKLKDNKTTINGQTYEMTQHGFVRDMEFEEASPNEYVLKSNEETKIKYPFDFELYVKYSVADESVITEYKVINKSNIDMPFGIGGHPAYKINYSNASVEFEKEENIQFYTLRDGLLEKAEKKVTKEIKLDNNSFDNDAIIMSDIDCKKVIVKENGKKVLEFEFEGFPYFAIWSKEDAPFLCLEPWYTTTDYIDSNGVFSEKPDTIVLKPNEEFNCKYKVRLEK